MTVISIKVVAETKDSEIPVGHTSKVFFKNNERGDKVSYFKDTQGTMRQVELYDRLKVIEVINK